MISRGRKVGTSMALSRWMTSITRMKAALSGELKAQMQPLRSRLLQDPYYRLQSYEEVKLAAALGIYIDANLAGVDDWLRLPGISIHQARSLTALTQAGVPFHCLEDVAAALGLPVARLRPLESVLRFCYYDADSVCTIQLTLVNTASVEQLARVPGIDLFLARAIVSERRSGPFRHLADLQQRLSIAPALTAELLHYLRF